MNCFLRSSRATFVILLQLRKPAKTTKSREIFTGAARTAASAAAGAAVAGAVAAAARAVAAAAAATHVVSSRQALRSVSACGCFCLLFG